MFQHADTHLKNTEAQDQIRHRPGKTIPAYHVIISLATSGQVLDILASPSAKIRQTNDSSTCAKNTFCGDGIPLYWDKRFLVELYWINVEAVFSVVSALRESTSVLEFWESLLQGEKLS